IVVPQVGAVVEGPLLDGIEMEAIGAAGDPPCLVTADSKVEPVPEASEGGFAEAAGSFGRKLGPALYVMESFAIELSADDSHLVGCVLGGFEVNGEKDAAILQIVPLGGARPRILELWHIGPFEIAVGAPRPRHRIVDRIAGVARADLHHLVLLVPHGVAGPQQFTAFRMPGRPEVADRPLDSLAHAHAAKFLVRLRFRPGLAHVVAAERVDLVVDVAPRQLELIHREYHCRKIGWRPGCPLRDDSCPGVYPAALFFE